MAYSTWEEAEKVSPQTSDLIKTGDGKEIDTVKVLEIVDIMINAELNELFIVPFASPYPSLIITIAEMLYVGFAFNVRYTEDDPNQLEDNWMWLTGWNLLQRIRSGSLILTESNIVKVTSDTYAKKKILSNTVDDYPVFNLGDETCWREVTLNMYRERIYYEPIRDDPVRDGN